MAGENKIRGAISFTPIVTIAAGSDPDADAIEVIHHDIKTSQGGPMNVISTSSSDKWWHAPNVIVEAAGGKSLISGSDDVTDLVGASGDQVNGPNEAAGEATHYTDMAATVDGSADTVQFIYIKNTGTSDTSGTITTNNVILIFDGGSGAYASADGIKIGPGEAWMGRLNSTLAHQVRIVSALPSGGAYGAEVNGSTSVRCTAIALITDVDG